MWLTMIQHILRLLYTLWIQYFALARSATFIPVSWRDGDPQATANLWELLTSVSCVSLLQIFA